MAHLAAVTQEWSLDHMTVPDMNPRAGVEVHLRPRQIAERHHITERTVRRWIVEGKLDVHRIGRGVFVTAESVERLFREAK